MDRISTHALIAAVTAILHHGTCFVVVMYFLSLCFEEFMNGMWCQMVYIRPKLMMGRGPQVTRKVTPEFLLVFPRRSLQCSASSYDVGLFTIGEAYAA